MAPSYPCASSTAKSRRQPTHERNGARLISFEVERERIADISPNGGHGPQGGQRLPFDVGHALSLGSC